MKIRILFKSTIILFVLCFIFSSNVFAGKKLEKLKKIKKVKTLVDEKIIPLLQLVGGNAKNKYTVLPWRGSTTEGFDIKIPGTNLDIISFYTRTHGTKWHIGIMVPMHKKSKGILNQKYISDIIGNVELQYMMLVLSEGDGIIRLKQLSDKFRTPLEKFKLSDCLNRKREQVMVHKGTNFFALIKPPTKGALKVLERIVLLGGKTDGGSMALSGSLNTDILVKLLNSGDRKNPEKQHITRNNIFEGLSFKLGYPPIIPPPFSFMNSKSAKKLFYMSMDATGISFDWDKKSKKIVLKGNREVSIWILNKKITIENILGLSYKKQKKKTIWKITSDGSFDFKSNPIKLLHNMVKVKKVYFVGELEDIDKPKKHGVKKPNKIELGIKIGAILDVGNIKDLNSNINLNLEHKTEMEFKGFGFSIVSKIPMKKIPMIKKVPLVNEFVLEEVSVGIDLNKKSKIPDIYLAGALKWKKIEGQAGLLLKMVNENPEFIFISKITDFSLGPFVDAVPPFPGTGDIKKLAKNIFNSFKLPNAVFMLSTLTEEESQESPLRLENLPDRLQSLFDGIIDDAEGKIPLFGDGVALIGAVDLSGVNKLLKQKHLKAVFKNLGVGKEMKKMAVENPIIIAASLGGLRRGTLKAGLYVDLPNFRFPGTLKPVCYLIQPKSGTASFFIRTDLAALDLEAGVSGQLDFNIPQIGNSKDTDDIVAAGQIYLNLDALSAGTQISAFIDGKWKNPFGIGNLALTDTAVLLGVDTNLSVLLGIGGGYEITLPKRHLSPFPSPLHPKESAKYLKGFLHGKNKHKIKKLIHSSGKMKNKKVLKYGMAGLIALSFEEEIPIPTKLALYYQLGRSSNILTSIETCDALFKGIVAGPAAKEIIKQAGHVLKKLHGGKKAAKMINVMQIFRKKFAESPNLVDLFHLEDLPLFMLEFEDVLVYLATPGAVLPGFPEIEGIGFKLMGELDLIFFGRHELGKVDFRLTMNDGLKIYAELGDIDLKFFYLKNVKFDLHAGIPVINGPDVPHFRISGDAKYLFRKTHGKIDISNNGIIVEASDYLEPFGGALLRLHSKLKKGKKITDHDGLLDFSLDMKFKKVGIDKVLKKLICDQLMAGIGTDLKNAIKVLNKAKTAVITLNKKINKARIEVRNKIISTENAGKKNAEKLVNKLVNKRNSLKHEINHLSFTHKWKAPGLWAAIKTLNISISVAQKALSAYDNVKKDFSVPTDTDPLVWPIIAERSAAMVVLNTSDHALQTLKAINNKSRQFLMKSLGSSIFRDPVDIRNLELSSDSLKSGILFAHIDMTIDGKKIKTDIKIDTVEEAKVAKQITKKIVQHIINASHKEINTIISNLKNGVSKSISKTKHSYNVQNISLSQSSLTHLAPEQIQKLCGTRTHTPEICPGTHYLVSIKTFDKKHFITQIGPEKLASRDYHSPFILSDLNGGLLKDGDKVSLLSPVNRYVTAWPNNSLTTSKNILKCSGYETFTIHRRGPGKDSVIKSGNKVSFLSSHNKYISAYGGGGKSLKADRRKCKGWETFQLMSLKKIPAKALHKNESPWEYFFKK